jgi:2-C-methyl-D-erythritol 4-phosphate cytidylyltransferase
MTSKDRKLWFVVPAAGIGQRMRANRPKQYLSIANISVIEHTLHALLQVKHIAGIVVAIHPEDNYWSTLSIAKHKQIHTVTGGDERCDSVLAALQYVHTMIDEQDWVLVHDAARPCVCPETIDHMVVTLQHDKVGGVLGVSSSDTLKQCDKDGLIQKTIDRTTIWRAQTPQMFRYGILQASMEQAMSDSASDTGVITDEASAVEKKGYCVRMVQGRTDNIKITHPDDLWMAEAILARRQSS